MLASGINEPVLAAPQERTNAAPQPAHNEAATRHRMDARTYGTIMMVIFCGLRSQPLPFPPLACLLACLEFCTTLPNTRPRRTSYSAMHSVAIRHACRLRCSGAAGAASRLSPARLLCTKRSPALRAVPPVLGALPRRLFAASSSATRLSSHVNLSAPSSPPVVSEHAFVAAADELLAHILDKTEARAPFAQPPGAFRP
jgi:hypothetical protein